jgi:hypothetical protein
VSLHLILDNEEIVYLGEKFQYWTKQPKQTQNWVQNSFQINLSANTFDLCLEGTWFKSMLVHLLFWLEFMGIVVFLSPSKQMLGKCLETGHDNIFLYLFQFTVHNQPPLPFWIASAVDTAPLNNLQINCTECRSFMYYSAHVWPMGWFSSSLHASVCC